MSGKTPRIAALAVALTGLSLVAWSVVRGGSPSRADEASRAAAPSAAASGPSAAATAPAAAAQPAQEAGQAQDAQEAEGDAEADAAQPPGQTAEQAIAAHRRATRGPEQPIPFSHRFHVSELRIDCMYCHVGTERSDPGILPTVDVCMGCHRVAGAGLEPIAELRDHAERGEPIAWAWVNRLPGYVQFSHRAHLRNDVECQDCHGPVEEMDRVYQWAPLTMGWCLECHRSPPREGDVATDYRLSREADLPSYPSERQPHSLYPLAIDTRYGASRGPIDCAVCHY